jgi:hypothetical protein
VVLRGELEAQLPLLVLELVPVMRVRRRDALREYLRN